MTMDCPSCAAVAANPHSGLYHADCPDCTARAVAGSPQFFAARAAGEITASYRAMLEAVFGADWQAWHERAKVWRGWS